MPSDCHSGSYFPNDNTIVIGIQTNNPYRGGDN